MRNTWHCFLFQYTLLGTKLFFSNVGRQMPHSILGPFPSDYCTHLRTVKEGGGEGGGGGEEEFNLESILLCLPDKSEG